MNRRTFVKRAMGTAVASAVGPALAAPKAPSSAPAIWTRTSSVAPSDTVRLAIIGPGSRGKDMMRRFLRVEGVEFSALCDIYEPRFEEARRITGSDTPAFTDYRRLIDATRDIDGVVIATPLGEHQSHMVDVLDAGLNLYGEKSLALTVEGCDAIRDAVRRNSGVFQIGHQYRYAGWYREAVRRIRAGDIGRVTHIQSYWHRNYNWRRPVPDPSLERLINWRLYRELSGGLLAELGSHHIDAANWIFDAVPERVVGSGGITFYDDGRETFDNVQTIFDYPGGRRLFFSSIIGNRKTGFQLHVYGTSGTIVLTLEDAHIYYEQATRNSAVPEELLDDGRYTSPSLGTRGDMPYAGNGIPLIVPEADLGDPNTLAAAAFVDHVRSGTTPLGDINVGWGSGYAVARGNQALRTGETVHFPND